MDILFSARRLDKMIVNNKRDSAESAVSAVSAVSADFAVSAEYY